MHAAHAGLGDRIFLLNRLALRLEGRGYYAPKSCCVSSKFVGVMGTAGLSYFIGGGGGGGGGGPPPKPPPPIPKEKRDSIIAAAREAPPAPAPQPHPAAPP